MLCDNTITPIASQAKKIKRRIVSDPTSLSEDSWYAIHVSLLVAINRRNDWQQWRMRLIKILNEHINSGRTCDLLREQPKDGTILSCHIAEVPMRNIMSLQLFLRIIYIWDDEMNERVSSKMHAKELAENAGKFLGVSKSFVY